MKKLLLLFVSVVMVFFLLNCSKEESNPVNSNNPTLSGNWKGKAIFLSVSIGSLDANLSQSGNTISGSSKVYGAMLGNSDTLDCSVSGNNNYPNVSFTSTAQASGGMYSLTFTGNFINSDSLSGTFKDNGSGVSYTMGMKKQ